MKAIKVNADYEAVLFGKKESLPVINQALEFLALFIDDRPLLSQKAYSEEYLKHVENFTGRRPTIIKASGWENWWGSLANIELERKLNSKEMSAELNLKEGWCQDTHIIKSSKDFPELREGQKYLAKNPHGMSGQNFYLVSKTDLNSLIKSFPVILEPLLNRVADFSHYVFPNGMRVCYQNIVDKRYQYRGTVFRDFTNPTLERLKFYQEIDPEEWKKFQLALDKIVEVYETAELKSGFSVDSFIYQDQGELKIRYLSEVNYRRTMGEVAFELSLKFGGLRKWSAFILTKKSDLDFSSLKKKISPIEWAPEYSRGVILLSPDDVRYDMFFLSALNETEGVQLLEELKSLLPDSEFPIEL